MNGFENGSSSNAQQQLSAFLKSPMMNRPGNPFGMSHPLSHASSLAFAHHRLSSSLGIHDFAAFGQFPPQRVQSTRTSLNSGLQSPLGMLSDIASSSEGPKAKRGGGAAQHDPAQQPDSKRLKMTLSPTTAPQALLGDNPALLDRLTSMGGGFPMPKWGGMKATPKTPTPTQEEITTTTTTTNNNNDKEIISRRGSFPMPALTESSIRNMSKLQLNSYKKLWQQTDTELRGEVLARRLHSTIRKMPLGERQR